MQCTKTSLEAGRVRSERNYRRQPQQNEIEKEEEEEEEEEEQSGALLL